MANDGNTPSLWRPGATLDFMRERMHRTLADHIGIELTELGADFLAGTLRCDERTCQPMRVLQGD